jgi:hypothetical protein
MLRSGTIAMGFATGRNFLTCHLKETLGFTIDTIDTTAVLLGSGHTMSHCPLRRVKIVDFSLGYSTSCRVSCHTEKT